MCVLSVRWYSKQARHLTGSVHGGTRSFEGAEALPSEGHVLLIGRQGLGLQQLAPLLVPQDGVDRLQEVLLTLWRTEGTTHTRAR